MVTTNQTSKIDKHTHKKRKESEHNTKVNQEIKREENERWREEKRTKTKTQTIKRMAIITYISIITSKVNRLNAPTIRHGQVEWIF